MAIDHERTTIRPVQASDVDQVVGLFSLLMAEGAAHDARYALRPDVTGKVRSYMRASWFAPRPVPGAFVADAAGSLVGYIALEIASEHPVLRQPAALRVHDLFVRDSHRRQGLATRLLQTATAAGKQAGLEQCTLSTLVADARARSFWKSQGFSEVVVNLWRDLS